MTEYDAALLVIDMQYTFKAARSKRTIRNVVQAVRKAIEWRVPVIFLEYNGYKGTTRQVAKAADGYDKLHVVTKHYDDGCDELMEYLEAKDISIQKFHQDNLLLNFLAI